MSKIPVVWTNDDITTGQSPQLQRQLDFLDRHGIPGVMFVIPGTTRGNIDGDAELLRVIEKSRAKGHEYFQHGHVHTPFESGVPELWMLDFDPATRRRYDTERFAIEAGHTLEALVTMIEKGRRIWRAAFAEDSPGYRPGWGAFCTNLYRALRIMGFDWVSSSIPCPTSWLWNMDRWDEPINFRPEFPTDPHKIEGIMEFPIGGDYAFQVVNHEDKIDRMVDLAMREFEIYYERRHPMLLCSHWHGLQRPGDKLGAPKHPTGTGYAVHEKLIPALQATGRAEFIGMTELVKRYGAGA